MQIRQVLILVVLVLGCSVSAKKKKTVKQCYSCLGDSCNEPYLVEDCPKEPPQKCVNYVNKEHLHTRKCTSKIETCQELLVRGSHYCLDCFEELCNSGRKYSYSVLVPLILLFTLLHVQ